MTVYVHNFFHYPANSVFHNVDNIKNKMKIINVNVLMVLLLELETPANAQTYLPWMERIVLKSVIRIKLFKMINALVYLKQLKSTGLVC